MDVKYTYTVTIFAFVDFLISPNSVRAGSYALTELA